MVSIIACLRVTLSDKLLCRSLILCVVREFMTHSRSRLRFSLTSDNFCRLGVLRIGILLSFRGHALFTRDLKDVCIRGINVVSLSVIV